MDVVFGVARLARPHEPHQPDNAHPRTGLSDMASQARPEVYPAAYSSQGVRGPDFSSRSEISFWAIFDGLRCPFFHRRTVKKLTPSFDARASMLPSSFDSNDLTRSVQPFPTRFLLSVCPIPSSPVWGEQVTLLSITVVVHVLAYPPRLSVLSPVAWVEFQHASKFPGSFPVHRMALSSRSL